MGTEDTRFTETDEAYIRRTFELAEEALKSGDYPFGALIVQNGEVVTEAMNTAGTDFIGHAEANTIKQAEKLLGANLSGCTLYSNFEPCAMCAFLARDYNLGRIVFSVASPHWGGVSRWDILKDIIADPSFTSAGETHVPEVVGGVLEDEGREIFDRLNWKMHTI